jgi:hypothetical protein
MSLETANKDLSRVAAKLQALAKHILESAKHQEKTPSDRLAKLEEAARLASDINLEECRTMLQAQLDEARQQRTAEIHSRREALLNAARSSGVPTDPGTNGDRIDVFRLTYEGAVVAISFGGVALPKLKETNGAKVLEHLKKLRDTLQQAPFNRESFLKLLKAAYATRPKVVCRATGVLRRPAPRSTRVLNDDAVAQPRHAAWQLSSITSCQIRLTSLGSAADR